MRKILTTFLTCAVCLSPMAVHADDNPREKSNIIAKAYQELSKDLDKVSTRHFNVIYSNYNLIKVVKTVQDSRQTAVSACGEKHPAMKTQLDARVKEWNDAINPILKEAEGNIDNMVLVQEYIESKKIKDLFQLIDKTRAKEEASTQKIPSTTEDSCNFLMKQMDDTQEKMINLLKATLISLPLTIQKETEDAMSEQKDDA